MRFLALSLSLVAVSALLLNTAAEAHQYKFMCKNMFWVNQLKTVDAKSEDEARFKLKHDKEYKDYSHCSFQTMKTDEELKRTGNQDSWGKRMIKKFDQAVQMSAPPPTEGQ